MTEFKDILAEMQDLYDKKNHDYGDSFSTSYRLFGLVAPLVRMNDKMNRLNKLYQSDSRVTDESIRDTLIDLANYAVMTILELDKHTAKPMTKERFEQWVKEYGPGPDTKGPTGVSAKSIPTTKPLTDYLSRDEWRIITAHLPKIGGEKHENDKKTS